MSKIITFGEVLMRLSPPEKRTLQQAHQFDFFFGGTEMNVAASLATFGCEVQHISTVSNDFVGKSAVSVMQSYGIDVTHVKKNEYPLGIYFLEVGSAMRPSRISYNRLQGAFAHINPDDVAWEKVLEGASYLHWTGISPGVSESAYKTLLQGLQKAQEQGVIVTADPAYRKNLWQYGKVGNEVLGELVSYSTIFIGGVNEINEILQENFSSSKEGFIEASKALKKTYPSIEKIFDKIRVGLSASCQKIKGRAWVEETFIETEEIEINNIIDRIGTGDAFAAGLIYGLQHYNDHKALKFANAACALKHTIVGDANLSNVEEVLEVANGNLSGRIKR